MRKLFLALAIAALPAFALASGTSSSFNGNGSVDTGSFGGSFSASVGDGVAQGFASSNTAATGSFTNDGYVGTSATSFTSGEESWGSSGGFSGAVGGGLSSANFNTNTTSGFKNEW